MAADSKKKRVDGHEQDMVTWLLMTGWKTVMRGAATTCQTQFQALFTRKLIYSLHCNSHTGWILFSLHFTDGETEACSLKTCPGSHRKQRGQDLSTSNLAPDPRLFISSPKAAPSCWRIAEGERGGPIQQKSNSMWYNRLPWWLRW